MNPYVTSSLSPEGITTITFFHPSQNSLPNAILQKLAAAITEAGRNLQTRLIILKSGGELTFCAGASFDELIAIQNEAEGYSFFSGFAHVINANNVLFNPSFQGFLDRQT